MTTAAEFTIPISELDAGGKAFDFPIRVAWLRGALEETDAQAADREGALAVRVSKSGHDVIVHGKLAASVVVPCARCLKPATIAVDHPISVMMVPAARLRDGGKGKADEDGEKTLGDDPDVLPYTGETVVLDDLVRDEILLEIPMIPLCSEDCPGIHPTPEQPAEEKAVDPRLAPLLRLKKMTKE